MRRFLQRLCFWKKRQRATTIAEVDAAAKFAIEEHMRFLKAGRYETKVWDSAFKAFKPGDRITITNKRHPNQEAA